jgi:hypothetical protein
MTHKSRTGLPIGLAAAAAAFGAAPMLTAATAPTARADDFTEILDDTATYYSAAQGDFTAAEGDFSSGLSGVPDGLQELFAGVDNVGIGGPDEFLLGSVEALQNQPIEFITPGPFGPSTPELDLATGLTDAQSYITAATTSFTDAAENLSEGNYTDALVGYLDGSFFLDFASQDVLSGAVDQLSGSI